MAELSLEERNRQWVENRKEEWQHKTCADQRQVGGTHYKKMIVQPWEALGAWETSPQFQGYLLGTAIAYLARFNVEEPGKGGRQDVEKAIHVLEKLLEVIDDGGRP